MTRLVLSAIGGIVSLASLCLVLRHDLALLAWRQGKERLGAGDHRGALVALGRAAEGSPGSLPIAYDRGVVLYRLGDFQQARTGFLAASGSGDGGIRAAALFNLGNCAFRQGEKAAGTDRQAAQRLFREAATRYGEAAGMSPGASDARQNLAIVRTRLAELARAAADGSQGGAARSGDDRAGKGPAKGGKGEAARREGEAARREGEASGEQRSEKRGKETAGRSPGEKSDAPAHPGKARPRLTREEAEGLLNQARGREAMSAALQGKGGGRLARPEKDW